MRARKCGINFLRKVKLRDISMVLLDIEMVDSPEEGQTSIQQEYIEMIDVPE